MYVNIFTGWTIVRRTLLKRKYIYRFGLRPALYLVFDFLSEFSVLCFLSNPQLAKVPCINTSFMRWCEDLFITPGCFWIFSCFMESVVAIIYNDIYNANTLTKHQHFNILEILCVLDKEYVFLSIMQLKLSILLCIVYQFKQMVIFTQFKSRSCQ